MKKIMNGLNVISIMSWIVTLIIMGVIWYLSLNEMSFRWVWNDVSRSCDSESIISMLHKLIIWVVVLAGSTNIFSSLIRKLTGKTNEGCEEDEFEEAEPR